MTKLFALGGIAALGAGAFGAVRAAKRRAIRDAQQNQIDAFDYGDLDVPVVVTEEIIVVTEAESYEIDMELVPVGELGVEPPTPSSETSRTGESLHMLGRDAAQR